MTEFVDVPGGRIAYDATGSGPLVVLSHGIGVRLTWAGCCGSAATAGAPS